MHPERERTIVKVQGNRMEGAIRESPAAQGCSTSQNGKDRSVTGGGHGTHYDLEELCREGSGAEAFH